MAASDTLAQDNQKQFICQCFKGMSGEGLAEAENVTTFDVRPTSRVEIPGIVVRSQQPTSTDQCVWHVPGDTGSCHAAARMSRHTASEERLSPCQAGVEGARCMRNQTWWIWLTLFHEVRIKQGQLCLTEDGPALEPPADAAWVVSVGEHVLPDKLAVQGSASAPTIYSLGTYWVGHPQRRATAMKTATAAVRRRVRATTLAPVVAAVLAVATGSSGTSSGSSNGRSDMAIR